MQGRRVRILAGLVATTVVLVAASAAEAAPGDILLTDQGAGNGPGVLYRIDPDSGALSVIHSGPPFSNPFDVEFEDGRIFVSDQTAGGFADGALFRIDPGRTTPTQITPSGVFFDPGQIAVESTGKILLIDSGRGVLFRVDPNTGTAPAFAASSWDGPVGVAADPTSGQIYVTEPLDNVAGSLWKVNPNNGLDVAPWLSGAPFDDPFYLAIDAKRQILLTDQGTDGGTPGVFRIDPNTGTRPYLASGAPFHNPSGVAVEASGDILVADESAFGGNGALFRVDATSGAVTVVASGSPFQDPVGVAVEPPICQGQQATIVGSPSKDTLKGSDSADVIVSLGGADKVAAGGGNDLVCGGAGADLLAGGARKDTLLGQSGNDTLKGGKHKDRLFGNAGKDTLKGGKHRDHCVGGKHADNVSDCEKGNG